MQLDLFDSTTDKILDTKTYADFKDALANSGCTKCTLCENRHNIVVDRGNPQARILMIGEAPGENEDLQGKAFVGRAGKLLDQLMQEVGINTNQDTLIANVVKCRPPQNRAPKPDEVKRCLPYLHQQIKFVKPKVIVLLGATSLKHLIPSKRAVGMAEVVGKPFQQTDYPSTWLMVLYHPAYILRDPRKKPVMLEHLARLKQLIDERSN